MKSMMISVLSAAAFTFGLSAQAAQHEQGHNAEMRMGGMKMDTGSAEHGEEIAFGAPGMAGNVTRTITVTLQDIAYDLKDLKVKDGETIRFIVVNKDDTDHEFTLGTTEMQAADRERMEKMMAMDMPMEMEGEANAVSVPALETRELIWTFKGPGQIEFACNIPGHYDAGMKGDVMIMN